MSEGMKPIVEQLENLILLLDPKYKKGSFAFKPIQDAIGHLRVLIVYKLMDNESLVREREYLKNLLHNLNED